MAALVTAGGPADLQGAQRARGRGIKWVRSNPLTVTGLVLMDPFDAEQYRRCGMETAMLWKASESLFAATTKAGLRWHGHAKPRRFNADGNTTRFDEEMKSRLTMLTEKYPGCTGWLVWDEPQRVTMPVAGKITAWLRKKYPEKLIYSNALPKGANPPKYWGGPPKGKYNYELYLRDMIRIVRPDVLMLDQYPFAKDGDTTPFFFWTIANVREEAMRARIPYWIFVQAYETKGGKRLPSESDLRMQTFVSLAYGYTGIAYFTYCPTWPRAMLDKGGKPNYLYHAAKSLNREVVNVGQALRFLTSQRIYYVPGRHRKGRKLLPNTMSAFNSSWQPRDGRSYRIRNIVVEDEGPERDALVGYFTDDRGQKYFMLVNLWHDMGASAAERMLTVTVHFDHGVQRVARLSRQTGRGELMQLKGGRMTVTLPGGTGDLFRIGGTTFPGVPAGKPSASSQAAP